jgi:hypothetical protein
MDVTSSPLRPSLRVFMSDLLCHPANERLPRWWDFAADLRHLEIVRP